jgi:hypothetical protein
MTYPALAQAGFRARTSGGWGHPARPCGANQAGGVRGPGHGLAALKNTVSILEVPGIPQSLKAGCRRLCRRAY